MSSPETKNIEEKLTSVEPYNAIQLTQKTLCEKLGVFFSNITEEPLMVLYLLPMILSRITTQYLTLEKACRVNLQYNASICDSMTTRNAVVYNNSDEIAVQKMVASMYAWKTAIHSFFPAILIIFLGSWSDRHRRRKPCMLLPLFGEIFISIGLLLCTYFFYELPMEWNGIVESVPQAFTGSPTALFMGVFSYVGEVASVETRTLRLGAVHIVVIISVTIGSALSGILYKNTGFYGVFSITLSTCIIGFMYGLFRIPETNSINNDNTIKPKHTNVSFFKDFFNWKHVANTIRVVFKNGERNRKKKIFYCTILIACIFGPLHGEAEIVYLFVRYKYQWNEVDYSIYSTYTFIVHVLGFFFAVGSFFALTVFSKCLKMDDALLGVFSCVSKILSCTVYAFAPTSTIFYLGALIDMFNGIGFIAMRSIVSKLVPANELGQVNSLFGVAETLVPFVYGPMYSLVYRSTIKNIPGAFYFIGGIINIPAAAIYIWLYTEHQKDAREEQKNVAQKEELLK